MNTKLALASISVRSPRQRHLVPPSVVFGEASSLAELSFLWSRQHQNRQPLVSDLPPLPLFGSANAVGTAVRNSSRCSCLNRRFLSGLGLTLDSEMEDGASRCLELLPWCFRFLSVMVNNLLQQSMFHANSGRLWADGF